MEEPTGVQHGDGPYEEVDGVPVLPRGGVLRERIRSLPARPAISAAAGGLVVGVAAVGLLQRRSTGRRQLPAVRRRALRRAPEQPLQLTRIVTTRSVQVTVHTLLPIRER